MKTKSDYRKCAPVTGSTCTTGAAPYLPELSVLPNAERCKRYRRNKKITNPHFQEDERGRQQQRRLLRTPDQIQRDRDTARERMRRLRERRAEKVEADQSHSSSVKAKTVVTRKQKETERLKWKNAKRKYRSGLSAQKKRRIREADRLRKDMKSAQNKSCSQNQTPKTCTREQTKYTPEGERKAIYRAKCKLPKEPGKFASVVKGLITTATPRKRHAIETEMQLLTPLKKKRLEFCDKAMQSFQESYDKLKRSRKTKDIKAKKVFASQLSRIRKYRLLKFCSSEVGIRYKSLLKWSKLDVELDCSKGKRSDAMSEEFVQKVRDFFVKPTISVTHATKKTVLKKQMKQRHTLNYTLEAAHKKFKEEHQSNISFSKFASLKPRNVETVGKRIYTGCLCEQCTNIELQLKGLNRKINHQHIIKNKYEANDLTLCNYEKDGHPKLQCVRRECELCGTKIIEEKLRNLTDPDEEAIWNQWEMKSIKDSKTKTENPRKMLVQHVGSYKELLDRFVNSLETFSMHLFIAIWQYQQFVKAKDGLVEGQVLCVMDFAENMTLRNQEECQSAHWYAQQVTIHSIVCYYLAQGKENPDRTIVTHELVFISDDLNHDAHMVERCVTEALRLLGEIFLVTHLIQFTDGCSAQYKSKTPFADISFSEADHSIKLERHFFGTSHGKGPADGCSGVIKSSVSRALKAGTVLNSASDMFNYCRENLSKSKDKFSRTFVYINSQSVVRNRPDRVSAQTIKGTRQLHSVKPGSLAVRKLSCCCNFCLNGKGSCPNVTFVDDWKIENIFKRDLQISKNSKNQKSKVPKKLQKKHTEIPDLVTDKPVDVPRDQYFFSSIAGTKQMRKL